MFIHVQVLYLQIRRMMGAMVAVAKGHVTLEQLKDFLGNPSIKNPGRIQALPGYGLFLKEVRYPGHVYNYNRSELRLMEVLEDPAGRQHISECVPARTDLAVCDPAEDLVNVDSKADVGLLDTNVTADGNEDDEDCEKPNSASLSQSQENVQGPNQNIIHVKTIRLDAHRTPKEVFVSSEAKPVREQEQAELVIKSENS